MLICFFISFQMDVVRNKFEIIEDDCNVKMFTGFCFMHLKEKNSDCITMVYDEDECHRLLEEYYMGKKCWAFNDKENDDCRIYTKFADVLAVRNSREPMVIYVGFIFYLICCFLVIIKLYRAKNVIRNKQD